MKRNILPKIGGLFDQPYITNRQHEEPIPNTEQTVAQNDDDDDDDGHSQSDDGQDEGMTCSIFGILYSLLYFRYSMTYFNFRKYVIKQNCFFGFVTFFA